MLHVLRGFEVMQQQFCHLPLKSLRRNGALDLVPFTSIHVIGRRHHTREFKVVFIVGTGWDLHLHGIIFCLWVRSPQNRNPKEDEQDVEVSHRLENPFLVYGQEGLELCVGHNRRKNSSHGLSSIDCRQYRNQHQGCYDQTSQSKVASQL